MQKLGYRSSAYLLRCSDRKFGQLQAKLASSSGSRQPGGEVKGAPDPVAREVYRGLLCHRKMLQKPTDSVPQQDCGYQKLKSGCEN